MKRIGLFTSGGDAPGMNACIRAVVRAGAYYGVEILGIRQGYEGMMRGDFGPMDARSVSYIIQRGGTILKSARCLEFKTTEGRQKAIQQLQKHKIDGLVAVGGDGTFRGAHLLYEESGIPIVGVPGTIDNDMRGTDCTIGYDTATNTAIEAIDKIRDTASSHNRLFFIEVMGRDAGYIAMRSGIATGAVAIMIPEERTTLEDLIQTLEEGEKNKKSSSLVIVAEGGKSGNAIELSQQVKERFSHYDVRVAILGHLQRGGAPSGFDRELAGRMGVAAVEALRSGAKDVMVGVTNNKITYIGLDAATKLEPVMDAELLRVAKILAT